jgi:tetratricopeptide (TPR) repeat protein
MGAPISEGVDISTTSQSNDKTNNTTNDDGDTARRLSTTYTSLIQQYLSMLCYENALFLAERFVAHQKTNESLYLLALCHYRNGSPQSAKAVLEQQNIFHQQTNNYEHSAATATMTSSSPACMQYLLAKCHYDLQQYGRAEDALLMQCRNSFRSHHQDSDLNSNNNNDSMDEWILSTTPCPIPNGAAGLHLLGEICRSSNRKDRAMQYYRMSLKVSSTTDKRKLG